MPEHHGASEPLRFVRFTDRSGTAWKVRSGFEALLFDGGDFLPPSRVASREEIKRTISRRVLAVDLAGPVPTPLIVKTYLARRGLDDFLRGVLYPSSAEIELRHALDLRRRGIEVAAPVASGRHRTRLLASESTLISERFPGGVELSAALREGRLGHSARLSIIGAAADLFRRLHDAGVIHRDPHLQNLLLVDGLAAPRLIPIDLRRIRVRRSLPDRARKENLALLAVATRLLASRSDRRRFIERYLGPAAPAAARKSFLADVEARGARILRRLAPVRVRKSLDGNRRFERRRVGGIRWHIRLAAAGAELESLLADPEAPFRDPRALLKSGRSSTVARWGRWVVKRFNVKRRRNLIIDRFRLSRPRRNFARALLLENLGIPTAPAIAAGERRVRGLVAGGYLVSLFVPGARSCFDIVRGGSRAPGPLRLAGRLIARLHLAALAHRDLKAPNILFDARGRTCLIDLDGLRPARRIGPRRAASNLARLARDLLEASGGSFAPVAEVLEGYRDARPEADIAALARRIRKKIFRSAGRGQE
jgi:tRNA A-37 threonylcarbamoyl transferase component Bud32